jgi:flagellar hook-associated protein 1
MALQVRHDLPGRQTLPHISGICAMFTRVFCRESWIWHGTALANSHVGDKGFAGTPSVSMNGILSSALSALQTNTTALGVVSQNVANLNTTGYAQRAVNEQTQSLGNDLSGVDVADIQRVTSQFLTQETLSANSASQQYSTESSILSQLNGLLGEPGDSTSLTSQIDAVSSALGSASLSPNSATSQQSVLSSYQNLASTISGLSSSISGLQGQVDQQVSTTVSSVNTLLQQIYSLNQQIQTAQASGNTSSGLLDQRDQAVQSLSQYIGVQTTQQPDGQLVVATSTGGVTLVGTSTYGQLSYGGGSDGSYPPIALQTLEGSTGQTIGSSQALDPDLGSGQLEGLVSMRDGALANFQQELGNFAQQTSQAFNAQSNANAAYPPPTSLTGCDTGLVSSDALNFTGQTTIAVADQSGNLVSQVNVDFDNGTLSVDGGPSVSIGTTIGSFTTALNSALGSNGTASFANGELSIDATGTNGIVVQDDAGDPSNRGGSGFSQFFGLNDVFQSAAPSILATGLSASDAGDFATGGTMQFVLNGPDGQIGKQASVTVTAGMTIGDIVNSLNTAFGGAASFSLSSNGTLSMTPSAANAGYQLNVVGDTTQRGSTGMSFTQLFGLGSQQLAAQAQDFSVTPALASNASLLAFGQPSISSTTAVGDPIVESGDSSGLDALQNVVSAQQPFQAAGALSAQSASLTSYVGSFYQDVANQTQAAQTNSTTQSDRLTEAQSQQSQVSGVNLDDQLSNMVIYQQAYGAGARMLQVAQSLYQTLQQDLT